MQVLLIRVNVYAILGIITQIPCHPWVVKAVFKIEQPDSITYKPTATLEWIHRQQLQPSRRPELEHETQDTTIMPRALRLLTDYSVLMSVRNVIMVQIMIEHSVMTLMRSYLPIQDLARAPLDISTLQTAYLLSTVNSALPTVQIATAPRLTIATLALIQMQSWIQP